MLRSCCVRASLRGFISFYLDNGSLTLKYVSSADSLYSMLAWKIHSNKVIESFRVKLRFKKKLAYSETIRVDSFDNGTSLICRWIKPELYLLQKTMY